MQNGFTLSTLFWHPGPKSPFLTTSNMGKLVWKVSFRFKMGVVKVIEIIWNVPKMIQYEDGQNLLLR